MYRWLFLKLRSILNVVSYENVVLVCVCVSGHFSDFQFFQIFDLKFCKKLSTSRSTSNQSEVYLKFCNLNSIYDIDSYRYRSMDIDLKLKLKIFVRPFIWVRDGLLIRDQPDLRYTCLKFCKKLSHLNLSEVSSKYYNFNSIYAVSF